MSHINAHQKREMRRNTHARYGGRCAYCAVRAPLRLGTVDHYLPRALGGTNERENLRWACRPCNERKADMHPDHWERVKPTPQEIEQRKAAIRTILLQEIARRGRLQRV